MDSAPKLEMRQTGPLQAQLSRISRKLRLAHVFLGLTAFLLLWRIPYYGKIILDDPYITFRYATNLVQYGELTYNLGEHVLATSTPVYAILMSGVEVTGFPTPLVATLVNLLFEVLLLVVLGLVIREFDLSLGQACLAYSIAGVLTVTNRAMSIASQSGLETPLFVLLNITTLLYVLRRQYLPATLAGSLAALTRPDGVLALALLGLAIMWRERRLPLREAGLSLLIGLPWITVAWLTYGSFIPHSITAKSAIEPIWGSSLPGKLSVVFYEPLRIFMVLALFPSLWAIWKLLRPPRQEKGVLFIIFLVIQLAYMVLPSNLGFEWYFAPLYTLLNITASLGVIWVLKSKPALAPLVVGGLALGVAYSSIGNYQSVAVIDRIWRDGMFQVIYYLKEHAQGDITVQCTNIGILGYYTDYRILDPLGLASPEVIPLLETSQNLQQLRLSVAQQFQPDYVVSFGNEPYAGYAQVAEFSTPDRPLIIYQRVTGSDSS